ncbi:multicopper oxidase domain-containing protein [Streptomyces sp. NPDC012510]|uniref:multicopper oxidase domain-containing protein n=1 Tax=Streptomyces sp. NPDC012510 TaxID=3364838 RepID=UPI0036E34D32
MELALHFDGPADTDAPYVHHCHLLYHEDVGMMGQFVVVEEGRRAGRPGGHDAHAGFGFSRGS